jgi:poly-gamma-glutamate synthase PgsB/CapB
MVIRSTAVRIVAKLDRRHALPLLLLARRDPSEHVRQELARALAARAGREAARVLCLMAAKEPSPRVRGVVLRALGERALLHGDIPKATTRTIQACLKVDEHPLVLRVALETLTRIASGRSPFVAPRAFCEALAALLASEALPAPLAEPIASTLRELEVEADAELASLRATFTHALAQLDEGRHSVLRLDPELAPERAVLALRVAARGDHATSLEPLGRGRFRLTRGEPRRVRAWRVLHEALTPMPDKRRGYVHSRGRARAGEYAIAPTGMAEVTPTRVPGERVLHSALGSWGSFLPRVDDLLDAAWARRPLRVVTPLGTFIVRGPRGLGLRWRAFSELTRGYAGWARLRDASLASSEAVERRAYAEAAAKLGFTLESEPRDGRVVIEGERTTLKSPIPPRYLSLLPFSLGTVPDWMQQMFVHALAPAANDPSQLALVAFLILTAFLMRAAFIMGSMVRAREAIPLTIGGWGTRGKSGSERLKAALFHALRYDVVVKTTGCEAMFIHAQRDLPAQEIFIYRPYDKATIWEQRKMLEVAKNLNAQVFLWECMALQPRFVDTLIDEWMQDPITTLTNAYPDHEDIQGPGGEDVARVIARFQPRGGVSFTTEEQMLPLLLDASRRKRAEFHAVAPLDADLLPVDLLNRLPYQEHPRNVALVLALGEYLGVDREVALIEIADHVVLDLGVLKTYPEARHRGRRLVFSNGMSANERAGFMSNWTRLGFDKHDPDEDDGMVSVCVVNNRADRVARSRVFAQIMVDDASVNAIVLINSNLGGMLTFITEALDKKLPVLRVTGEGGTARALERFDAHMKWLKIPLRPDALPRAVERVLHGVGASPRLATSAVEHPGVAEAIRKGDAAALGSALEQLLTEQASNVSVALRADAVLHVTRLASKLARARTARREVEKLLEASREVDADVEFRRIYREIFLEKVAVLWDTGATGDQVIDFVTNEIPPGHLARVMGTQNIKGTGLDFVYRWLSVDRVRGALERLRTVPAARQEILSWLGSYSDFGLLDARDALEACLELRGSTEFAGHESLLAGVISRLEKLVQEKEAKLHATTKTGVMDRVLGGFEDLVDHLDSAGRSRSAGLVMSELFAARVGHGRAALLLRELTGRQKGGWLAKDLKKWWKGGKS